MLFFTPTGGEPFIRADLPEIVKIFHTNNHALNVGIPTNGSMTPRVLRSVQSMLDQNPGIDLHIDVSIDGLPELHDEIRGIPGLVQPSHRNLPGACASWSATIPSSAPASR